MAITTSSTLTQQFVDQLSSELLLESDPQYIFSELAGASRAGALGIPGIMGAAGASVGDAMSQAMGSLKLLNPAYMQIAGSFCKVVSEPTTPGKVILVDQPRYLGGTMTEAARRLTEGTSVSGTAMAATMGQVSLTIREYAGPHNGSNVAPLGLSDFLKRRAHHNLVEYAGNLLRRDYNRWMDSVIIEYMLASTNVTTPSDTALGSLTAGSKLTEVMLSSILRSLQERNIPTFANGQYMLAISPVHLQDLKADTNFRESVRYLGAQGALVSGHVANHGGFMIVVSNNIPTEGVGAADAVTGYQALAFGPEAFGHAIGMDVEARRSKDDDYSREDRVIWLCHSGFALLDEDFVERIVTT